MSPARPEQANTGFAGSRARPSAANKGGCRGPGRPPQVTDATPATAELLRLMDATPVPCGTSAVTPKRSGLFGYAGYGYCASHSRWYWGGKLLLICTCDGTEELFADGGL
jgi:hypothetical protein